MFCSVKRFLIYCFVTILLILGLFQEFLYSGLGAGSAFEDRSCVFFFLFSFFFFLIFVWFLCLFKIGCTLNFVFRVSNACFVLSLLIFGRGSEEFCK